MSKHRLLGCLVIAVIAILALGCYFFFTRSNEGKHEQRAGEVYIIGDEIVYWDYKYQGYKYL